MKTYQEIIKPTLVLMIIASIIAALLAVTYNVTGVAELANAAYSAEEIASFAANALPGSGELTRVDYTPAEGEEDLNFVYTSESGAAIILNSKGYAADGITMMVGINPDGTPAGAHVIKHGETPGIGDKVCADTAFIASSAGKIAAGSEPDINAGATKSSNGINNGIKRAVELYNKLHGEGVI